MALSELLAAGVLPASPQPVRCLLAIASFDNEGNTSERTEPLTFTWQVLTVEALP
jgi:hypothetical protein